MDRLFLDANILFSAAYREGSGITQLWTLPCVTLITSPYAIEEARRNLRHQDQQHRLSALLSSVVIHRDYPDEALILNSIDLRPKDRPILAAAIGARSDYLITGDYRDFSAFYGKRINGVLILPPSDYLLSYTQSTS